MDIQKKDDYTYIKPTENSFEDFAKTFEIDNFSGENIIIDFLNTFEVTVKNMDTLAPLAAAKKEAGTSFILVATSIEIDDLEDESLSVVPTLGEAEDTLEMDAIERDLGL